MSKLEFDKETLLKLGETPLEAAQRFGRWTVEEQEAKRTEWLGYDMRTGRINKEDK